MNLFAGGVPCPPFSLAGAQLGHDDERDLFPQAIRLNSECSPKAIMLKNVKGLLKPRFNSYREHITRSIKSLWYTVFWIPYYLS